MKLKFRAWDKINRRMFDVVGLTLPNRDGVGRIHLDSQLIPWVLLDTNAVLMRSTELLDRDGVEIFEGDIVASHNDAVQGVVLYQAPEFIIKESLKAKRWSGFVLAASERQFQKVIGNIYENPELL